jgi:hypothetical protein
MVQIQDTGTRSQVLGQLMHATLLRLRLQLNEVSQTEPCVPGGGDSFILTKNSNNFFLSSPMVLGKSTVCNSHRAKNYGEFASHFTVCLRQFLVVPFPNQNFKIYFKVRASSSVIVRIFVPLLFV